ncbi:hypothetical protein [Iodobacter fluviatilis]|uniref:Uncharacterized protein n=1 Tax=Iodobacter fluviatilis TaxID=537 RepID=A0A377Q691_9NEIS|nr:hypothetical protein [Iodobacter fluviatilis]TCU86946.1 hypothetical protein EV682_10571 [Iodobacter fluviatilis]STQ90278.1 Uncharacterised protein [Iodobacter fluviatilis]
MLPKLFTLLLVLISMTTQAGNFFPPDYKVFPFKEGDLLVSRRGDGKFAVNKILKIDRISLNRGAFINIQGRPFVASEDDYLLVVSASYGDNEFKTFEEASAAAKTGKWTVKVAHTPNRAPGAATGQTWVGYAPVTAEELTGYKIWRQAFDNGDAGVF